MSSFQLIKMIKKKMLSSTRAPVNKSFQQVLMKYISIRVSEGYGPLHPKKSIHSWLR